MDDYARSHRRAVWLTVALVLAYALGLVGYELNWIHQRGAAWARMGKRLATMTMPPRPTQWQNLPPRGASPLDRLAMWLSGEPENYSFATTNTGGDAVLAAFANGRFQDDVLEGLDTVRHARWLFPEAQIVVEYYEMSDLGASNPVTAWKARADRLLSNQPPVP